MMGVLRVPKLYSKFIKYWVIGFLLLTFASTSYAANEPAKLWISPSNETHNLDEVFSFNLFVSSLTQPINAVAGQLKFSSQNVEITNISKSGSILTVWTQEPVYSNATGTLGFSGGLPTPGFTGAQGLLFSVSFKSKTPGLVSLSWGQSTVLANDGQGTNILGSAEPAGATILDSPVQPSGLDKTPVAPVVTESKQAWLADLRVILFSKAVLFFGSVIVVLLLLLWRERVYRKSQLGYTKALAGSLVEQEFSTLRKDVVKELWHLEKKMKRGEPFSREERERREKLLQEIGEHQKDTEERLSKI